MNTLFNFRAAHSRFGVRLLVLVISVVGVGTPLQSQTVIGWGADSRGQIDVPPSATNVVAVAAGKFQSLALRADGTVIGWGSDPSGAATPPPFKTNVIAIAAGYSHSLALLADGTVNAWGNNLYHQTNVPASASNIVA